MKRIVLASASPRRKALLEKLGLEFAVEPSHQNEDLPDQGDPHELAKAMSLKKAQTVAGRHRDALLVIAADTLGVLGDRLLGKPHNAGEARKMLAELSGKSHAVITGYTIIDTGTGRMVSRSVETRVYIKPLASEKIDAYVRTGEPLDKAGAYAIQGLGAVIVEKIEGDFYNVIGLPLSALAESLNEFGVPVLRTARRVMNG